MSIKMAPSAMEGVIMQSDVDAIEEEISAWGAHWLNGTFRCFGDKGDVEDITEGQLHQTSQQFTRPFCSSLTLLPQQLTSFPPSSSTTPAITWRPATKGAV